MDSKRRNLLKASGGAGALVLAAVAGMMSVPRAAFAHDWKKATSQAGSFADTVKSLGAGASSESASIAIEAPDIAENGAIVPISIVTTLPGVQAIAILLEKNPSALAASFAIPTGTEPFVSTRVKLAESSNVYALVKADGKYFYAVKEVKVSLGGCGG